MVIARIMISVRVGNLKFRIRPIVFLDLIFLKLSCNNDVIDNTFDSRSRSRARQETRETSCNHFIRDQVQEIKKRLARQVKNQQFQDQDQG